MKLIAVATLWVMPIASITQADPFADSKPAQTKVQEDETFKVFPDPAGNEYFPEDEASYYTRYLLAMKEPSVKAPLAEGVRRVFRFTYLRSFHDPLAVRIVEKDGAITATAIQLKKDPDHRLGKILHQKTWNLDAESSKKIQALLAQKDFWKPLNDSEQALSSGLDGSRWIFELHDMDGYRMLDIWSPDAIAKPAKELKKFGLDRLPKIIAETSIKDWYARLNSYGMANPSPAPASQSGHLHARRA